MALIQSGFSQADLAKMTPQDVGRRRQLAQQLMANQPQAREIFGVLANGLTGARSGYEDTAAREGESTNMARMAELLASPEAQSNDALRSAAMDAWASPQQSAMVNALIGDRREDAQRSAAWAREDARYAQGSGMRDLEMQIKMAELERLQNPQSNVNLGLQPQWGIGPDGKVVLGQMSSDGRFVPSALPDGVTPMDPRTLNMERAAGSAQGDAAGSALASAGGDIASADAALAILDQIESSPELPWATGFSAGIGANKVPGTGRYGFQNLVDQAKGGAFLTAIQEMRGLGALSNVEGQTATQAVTRMDTATSEADFRKALADYRGIVERGRARAQSRLNNQAPAGAVPQSVMSGGAPPSDIDMLLEKYR